MKAYWKFWLAGLIVLAIMVVGYEFAATPQHSNHDHQHEHHQHN